MIPINVLEQIVLSDAKDYMEKRINEELEKVLIETRIKAMQNLIYTIREDAIGDRLVMTLEIKKK